MFNTVWFVQNSFGMTLRCTDLLIMETPGGNANAVDFRLPFVPVAGEEGIPTTDGRLCIYAGKKSNVHAAAVVGDTVGDPLKDTSGPALNIVMKLMAIISVVFADFFMSTNHGNGLFCAGELPGGCF